MDNGVYFVKGRRIVINDHSTDKQKQNLEALLNDNIQPKSDDNSESLSKSGTTKRKRSSKSKS